MQLDRVLFLLAVSCYVVGALALLTYLFSRQDWLRTLGIPLALAGCLAQFVELGVRWQISHVWPLTNLYGSLSLFSAMSVLIFAIFAFRYELWFVGGVVLAIAAIGMSYGSTWNEGYMPAVPALQSYWIKIHVPLVVSAYASFCVAFALSALYLMKAAFESQLGRTPPQAMQPAGATAGCSIPVGASASMSGRRSIIDTATRDTPNVAAAAAVGNPAALWLQSLPSLAQLDVLQYRVIAVGLPLLTLGVITGAWWAKEAWGAYWQWDPKETAALFSWIVYASYMHLHTRNAWRGVRTSWVSVFGFLSIIFCYLGVNIWISGLHSYKM